MGLPHVLLLFDAQTVLMELHEVGPAKLFDTAGIDETGLLGEKKRRKVLSVIKVRALDSA